MNTAISTSIMVRFGIEASILATGPGESEFWQMLVAIRRDLLRVAFSLTQQDAEDLVELTLEKACEKRSQFDGRNLKAWCATILRNEFRDQLRHWWTRLVDSGVDGVGAGVPPAGEHQIMLKEVIKALQEMGGNCLEILLLTAKGFKFREISDVLGIPIGTLGGRVSQCRERLDRRLGLEGH